MEPSDVDWPVRAAAFAALVDRVRLHGEVLPWAIIDAGFTFAGQSFRFANQSKGIFRPAGMQDAALSVKTTVPRSGKPRYEDVATDDAFVYAFQSRGPHYHDNRLLRRAIELRTPLIYLYGVEPGSYRPLWPTYAALDSTGDHVLLTVSPAELLLAPGEHVSDPVMQRIVRRYATIEAKKRLHQDMFRGAVLRAYEERCSICRLPRRELLDAAHILPDQHPRGEPIVPNGLALCKTCAPQTLLRRALAAASCLPRDCSAGATCAGQSWPGLLVWHGSTAVAWFRAPSNRKVVERAPPDTPGGPGSGLARLPPRGGELRRLFASACFRIGTFGPRLARGVSSTAGSDRACRPHSDGVRLRPLRKLLPHRSL